ncbi:hypothetical protein CCB80_06595 [Armatimonadetes bacterium Uphvl-Ar1]|nr:hypothetical protein CCB80_06595 [Armatimonadetes bacterium Uphvl-Ar1]
MIDRYSRKSDLAFTLIELLIVIAIIAIIAAILFPTFARAKESAKRTVDLAHIKQIGVANLIYLDDYDQNFLSFPYADTWSSPSFANRQRGPYWSDRVMPYIKNNEIFQTPANTDTAYYPRGYWLPGAKSATDTQKYRVTYALNHLISRADMPPDRAGSSNQSSISLPADTVLAGPQNQAFTFSSCQPDSPGSQTRSFYWNISESGQGWGFELWNNSKGEGGFFGGANFTYVDGHAKFARLVNKGTDPGDQITYQGRDLFFGFFAGVKTRPEVSENGTCPNSRASAVF